jgi:hypothetical protein
MGSSFVSFGAKAKEKAKGPKMVDMKKSKEATKEMVEPSMPDGDMYPYGVRLQFDPSDVKKFPFLDGVGVGDMVHIDAIGEVVSVDTSARSSGNKEKRVSVQIKKMAVEGDEDED